MKKTMLIAGFACSALIAQSQDFKPVDEGSSVKFQVTNLGFSTGGRFSGLQGTIHFLVSNPSGSRFEVSVDAATVNTDLTMRDDHLRGEDFFDVKKYPRILFSSTSVSPGEGNSFDMTGKITIKDKTEEVRFPFTAVQTPDGYIFNGQFKINRKDFGVGGDSPVSNQVTVTLTLVAKKVN